MPFYIRKSISAGPFRFNFSKGGVGVSVGVKGLRFGTGPRGHYVHAGLGGLYYRATIGRAGETVSHTGRAVPTEQIDAAAEGVDIREVTSGSVMGMQNGSFGDLLRELNEKRAQGRMSTLMGTVLGVGGVVVLLPVLGPVALVGGLLYWIGKGAGEWFDAYRRSSVVFYDLEPEVEARYRALVERFDALAACNGIWHVQAGGQVHDLTTWKRNAGAAYIVNKKPTTLLNRLPDVIQSNVTPPTIDLGKGKSLYFMPDVVLYDDGSRYGAISYVDLRLRHQDSIFIESGSVPGDAEVIGHTWKHPNKKGGPDRRFANNYQIPMCRYEVILFSSDSGLNELVEFSRNGLAAGLAGAVWELARAVPAPAWKEEAQPSPERPSPRHRHIGS